MFDFINVKLNKELKKQLEKHRGSILILAAIGLVLIVAGIIILIVKLVTPKKEVNCDVDAEEDEEDFFEGENNIRSVR